MENALCLLVQRMLHATALGLALLALPLGALAEQAPVSITSVPAVAQAVARAHDVILSAYVLSPYGRMTRALDEAGRRGARVHVVLDGAVSGGVARSNRATAQKLREAGVRVDITSWPLHAKIAVVDGLLYLTDRNWASRGAAELVIRDDQAADKPIALRAVLGASETNDHFSTRKRDALALEARMIRQSSSSTVAVETEAFSPGTEVAAAIRRSAEHGGEVRLLIDEREYRQSSREQGAIARLMAAGIRVRVGRVSEKLDIAGGEAWVGSANMTPGVPDQIDWGLRMPASLVPVIATQFDRNWRGGRPPDELRY
jgi:phosphatidylserine/phosphatidylglycerophosphate/cardiolipin synthase-like enzyme